MDPQRIGPYELERELGAGGMGTVYLARHVESGRRVALKVLAGSLSREPGFVARFTREIEALRAVTSPHIVELYESGVDGETYYYAMEYVEGETLTARLEREKRLPWRDVIDYGVQVCKALKAAHNAGVIHRDLKPSNLLLTPDGQVKLTDFGVAQLFAGGKLTATGGVIGTAEYMSPEQAEGKRATKHSDIYALGAVMYVMLTGRPPFTGQSALEIAQKHRFGQFDSPRRFVPEIPHWLDEVVCKCLAKNPEQRYPDAYVLSLRLAEIPRKVELLASEKRASGTAGLEGGTETVAATRDAAAVDAAAAQVGGTFVRDMIRAELDRTVQRSALERWLDNTWVLAALLVLVIVTGVWFYRNRTPDAETLFRSGQQLLEQPRREEWLRADAEFFQPLLVLDRATWEPRIAPYRARIELAQKEAELLRLLRRKGGDRPTLGTESLRILDRVARDVSAGELDVARLRLRGLEALLPPDEEFALDREVVAGLLQHLPESPPSRDNQLLAEALTRMEQFQREGRWGDLRRMCEGILAAYRDDPSAAEAVRRAEAALAALPDSTSSQ
jgi:hypothetical protein